MANPPKKTLKRRNALGKGLGALLADSDTSNLSNEEAADIASSINEVALEHIEVNPFQPRQEFEQEALNELADSIKLHGIIQPVTLRKLDNKKFQLISGERRCQASRIAGLETVPAYVRLANDQQMLEMALIENIQREELNPIEIAFSYQRLIAECNLKQEQLGDRVGKKRATVTNYLRLLKLPPEVQASLRDGKISMGHARALINVENIDLQLAILHKAILEELSVRKVEELVNQSKKPHKTSTPAQPLDPEFANEIKRLQGKLSSHFGTKVSVKTSQKDKGEIKIPFSSTKELNRILDILNYQS